MDVKTQALITLHVTKAEKSIDDYFAVGKICKVPVEVSETQHIKIVADQRHCPTALAKWDMLAIEVDEETGKTRGSAFAVTEKELLRWQRQMS